MIPNRDFGEPPTGEPFAAWSRKIISIHFHSDAFKGHDPRAVAGRF